MDAMTFNFRWRAWRRLDRSLPDATLPDATTLLDTTVLLRRLESLPKTTNPVEAALRDTTAQMLRTVELNRELCEELQESSAFIRTLSEDNRRLRAELHELKKLS